MGKLRLKRTPEEQAAHDLRKAEKRARKATKHRPSREDREECAREDGADHAHAARSRKRRKLEDDSDQYDFVFDADDEFLYAEAGPSRQSHRAQKPDYDYIRAQLEEERFREKLAGAFDDDERLDSVEAKFNSYAHIPRRWRGGGMDRMDDDLNIDPQMMEEEDYAEWMRDQMWRCVIML